MQFLKTIFANTTHLFYPHICNGCGSDILSDESLLCSKCFINLPVTNFAMNPNNPIEKIFWGRIPLVAAHSEYFFSKSTLIQHLIHQLKYKGNTEIGHYLGALMGKTLLESKRFNIEGLIPLPLFPDKQRKRGYNQAAVICDGIAEVMQIPVLNDYLIRQHFTETQTKKHRTERWENVAESFAVQQASFLKGKHVLLVDDVVTTGATLEASAQKLLAIQDLQISIATLAFASK